ncbi:DNA polymerase III subunit epsilon [Salinisphaera sp. PC39]|uniref:DNA polymerase III subunit epsilon n=1 Tax=Salinisphaera sp. PC39 TaxID=1304156 RepID=UPI0033411496
MRQIVLDTETTGLEPEHGHRIIEIGCVEMVNRRLTGNDLHLYLNPDREIDAGAIEVHGITLEFLADKPRFEDVVQDLLAYLDGAELVIHNAPFDVGFIDHELRRARAAVAAIEERCRVIDTLVEARRMHPGQRNSLDALCKRYEIDNSRRELHGALLDAQILAEVYLAMTGGQTALTLGETAGGAEHAAEVAELAERLAAAGRRPRVLRAPDAEREAHQRYLGMLSEAAGGDCLWRELAGDYGD